MLVFCSRALQSQDGCCIIRPVGLSRVKSLTKNNSVTVFAPARLHMGFLDPNANYGRHFGSIGVALEQIATRLTIYPADQLGGQGPQSERAIKKVRKICRKLDLPEQVFIDIQQAIPDHIGLGSGTQMSLAIGMALSRLYNREIPLREIANLTDRGARSGIGIGAFEQGGLIVDGGRAEITHTPPVISRMEFPADWYFILAFDNRAKGLNGKLEVNAFHTLPVFPRENAAEICHRILMQGLPAIAEHNLHDFGTVITLVQRAVGDYFSPAQGGRFMSKEVEKSIHWMGQHGAVGLGQSSWGPTGFCIIEGKTTAQQLLNQVKSEFRTNSFLNFQLISARNSGGEINIDKGDAQSVNLNAAN